MLPTKILFKKHNYDNDGEPGGILSLGFLTESTQATKL